MRVLFIHHGADIGGAGQCLLELLTSLEPFDVQSLVVVPYDGAMRAASNARGLRTVVVPSKWWVTERSRSVPDLRRYLKHLPSRLQDYRRLIEAEKIDLVFTNTSVVAEGAMAACMTGRPHVWNVLEMLKVDPDLMPVVPLAMLQRAIGDLSTRVIAVSESVRRDLAVEVPAGKLSVVHTGITPPVSSRGSQKTRELLGLAQGTPVVLFAGLLSRRKGVLELVDAAALVLKAIPQAVFLLAGADGGCERQVRARIRELRIGSGVRLLGYRRDCADLLACCDMVVMPSKADPLPVSVLEAIHAGKPVVATRSGGCEEMIEDGISGYLVPVDDVAQMADRIINVLGDTSGAQAMGQRGRERAESLFSLASHGQAMFHVFQESVSAGPVSRQVVPDWIESASRIRGDSTLAIAMGNALLWARRGTNRLHRLAGR